MSEGQYNEVFLLTMNDGREVVAKLPNPNAGLPHFVMASEVATMWILYFSLPLVTLSFTESVILTVLVEERLSSSDPQGLCLELQNAAILLEQSTSSWKKQAGTMLSGVWEDMTGMQKAQIVKQVVDMEKILACH